MENRSRRIIEDITGYTFNTVNRGVSDGKEFPRPRTRDDYRRWERIDADRGPPPSMGANASILRPRFVLLEETGGESSSRLVVSSGGLRARGGELLEEDVGERETIARQNDLWRGCEDLEEHQSRVGARCCCEVLIIKRSCFEF